MDSTCLCLKNIDLIIHNYVKKENKTQGWEQGLNKIIRIYLFELYCEGYVIECNREAYNDNKLRLFVKNSLKIFSVICVCKIVYSYYKKG